MPKRKQPKQAPTTARTRATAWRIQKLDDVPGPEADAGALKAHYIKVQHVFAVHHYDDVIAACHWCCDMDEQLAFTKPNTRGGAGMYCSGRCASAFAKYQQLNYRKPGQDGPSTSVTSAAPRAEKLVGDDDEDGDGEVSPTETTETETEAAETPAPPTPSPDERWTEAKKNPQRKARKTRDKKPERTDGLCAKGLHKMTDANRYEYKGTVWCRECRKASRSRSANGSNGKGK